MNTTTIVNLGDFLTEEQKTQFWERASKALTGVLSGNESLARELIRDYRNVVSKSPSWEQAAVYHTEPIYIAIDLSVQHFGSLDELPVPRELAEIEREYASQFKDDRT